MLGSPTLEVSDNLRPGGEQPPNPPIATRRNGGKPLKRLGRPHQFIPPTHIHYHIIRPTPRAAAAALAVLRSDLVVGAEGERQLTTVKSDQRHDVAVLTQAASAVNRLVKVTAREMWPQ
ncbi:hypothetical protein [Saccharopolyspora pogona]|uniref:hypothetical protein n=1 Tax=Saccharopolyspora pogona TaxID=333966 RepID=UPI001CC25A79|nr:hypothetical protein [Saccharopolyspora pogona]